MIPASSCLAKSFHRTYPGRMSIVGLPHSLTQLRASGYAVYMRHVVMPTTAATSLICAAAAAADSLVSRFNLICADSWKIQLANSFMFIGCFIGSGLFGALSDRIGRKKPLFMATALAAAATFVSVAAPSYWFVAAMRLIVGMGAAGQVQGVVLLSMETTGKSFR